MAGEEQGVSADAVRAELRRILASPGLDASEPRRMDAPQVLHGHVAVAAAAAGLGLADEDAAVTRILSLDPDSAYNVAADLENRHVAPELVRAIVAIWILVAGIIAIRQALDFDTGRAILTAVIGWLALLIPMLILGGLF